MKFVKPKWEETVLPIVPNEVIKLYNQLPDEFEIVPEGHVCVKWPKEVTKEWLVDQAELCRRDDDQSRPAKLAALAAIAPESRKSRKRKVQLWEGSRGQRIWTHAVTGCGSFESDWRKVGECEIEEWR